jgi:hypothetical protein
MATDDDDFDADMSGDTAPTGAEVDDDDDQDDAADEADTDDPAKLKARLAKATAALRKANAQAAKLRRAGKPAAKAAPEGTPRGEQPAAAVAESGDDRFRRQAIRTEGAAAIMEAGFSGDRKAARDLTRLIDWDDLDVDEDGEVDGLDDAVDALKERYPGLFASSTPDTGGRQPRHRVAPIDANAGRSTTRRSTARAEMTSAERIGMALRGGK